MDRTKTLEELEGDVWEEPTEEFSHLIERCHALRRVPIQNLTPADLRILIGQSIGLEFLVPLALEVLERAPLIDAEFYPGDLLSCTLGRDTGFWRLYPEWEQRARAIFARAEMLSRRNPTLDAEDVLRPLRDRWS